MEFSYWIYVLHVLINVGILVETKSVKENYSRFMHFVETCRDWSY